MNAPVTLDLCGLNEGSVIGVTGVSPVLLLAAGLFVHDRAVSLDDQRTLTLMLGLDATPSRPPAAREARLAVRPDSFRRNRKRRR